MEDGLDDLDLLCSLCHVLRNTACVRKSIQIVASGEKSYEHGITT